MTDTVNTRRLALDVLLEVTEHGAYSNQVLRACSKNISIWKNMSGRF